jgi:hypothetical protein
VDQVTPLKGMSSEIEFMVKVDKGRREKAFDNTLVFERRKLWDL